MVANSPYSTALRDWATAKQRGDEGAAATAAKKLDDICAPHGATPATILDGLSQKEIQAVAALKRDMSDWRALFLIRCHADCLAVLVVANTSENALEVAVAAGVSHWTPANTETRAVQRNVDMPLGIMCWVPWRPHEGQHRVHTSPSRRRKAKRRAAIASLASERASAPSTLGS